MTEVKTCTPNFRPCGMPAPNFNAHEIIPCNEITAAPYVTEPTNISYAYLSSIALRKKTRLSPHPKLHQSDAYRPMCFTTMIRSGLNLLHVPCLRVKLPRHRMLQVHNICAKKCRLRALNNKTLHIPDVMMSCRVVTTKTLGNLPFEVCCAFLIHCLTAELSPPRY